MPRRAKGLGHEDQVSGRRVGAELCKARSPGVAKALGARFEERVAGLHARAIELVRQTYAAALEENHLDVGHGPRKLFGEREHAMHR